MKNHYPGLLPKAHLWTDVILLNLSFFLAYIFRFRDLNSFLRKPVHQFTVNGKSGLDLQHLHSQDLQIHSPFLPLSMSSLEISLKRFSYMVQ
jgi:hypothetical protein